MVLKRIVSGRGSVQISIICILTVFPLGLILSQPVERIDLERIPQEKVRNYIISRSIDKLDDFSSIRSSWEKDTNVSDYNLVENEFYLKNSLSEVWDCYLHTDPVKMWTGKSVKFGLMISKYSTTVLYASGPGSMDIDTGQVYFLNLRVMFGLINVPVAFEVITIDPERKILEFSYLDDNKSLGKQTIQFFDNGTGKTRIMHRSYFKSSSNLREKLFYPYFHGKLVRDFHRKMGHYIGNIKQASLN